MPCTPFSPDDPQFQAATDLERFNLMFAAMTAPDTLYTVQLECRDYFLDGTLHLARPIVLAGGSVNPHYAAYRTTIWTRTLDVVGVRMLAGCTIRDVEFRVSPSPSLPASDPNRFGSNPSAHGIWCRRPPKLINVRIERYPGD